MLADLCLPDLQQADAQTLITLLHLRQLLEHLPSPPIIVTEMLDSDRLTSAVFDIHFDHAGPKLYLRPAGDYVQLGQDMTFATVIEAARQRGEVAVGDRTYALARQAGRNYGVRLNPSKSRSVRYQAGDQIMVLAEGNG